MSESKTKNNAAIRGVSLDPADMADLQLLARADRRSFSFMVRDAISEFLKGRREQLEKLKTTTEKVQP